MIETMTEIRNFGLVICMVKTEIKVYTLSIKWFSCEP